MQTIPVHGLDDDIHLPGDALLSDAQGEMTHAITIDAPPDQIWPWLVQMGGGRAGWYSLDALDNANVRSEIRLRSDLQDLRVGDILPATPGSDDGFEVLVLDSPHSLVLGGLFVPGEHEHLGFHGPRPERYWHVTWAFSLQPLPDERTRLIARVRAAHSPDLRGYARWMQAVHHVMQRAQLRGIESRAEGTIAKDGWRDVLAGLVGSAGIVLDLLTPFLRGVRSHWGLDVAEAERDYPGDELVPHPRWGWTHGVEVDAPVDRVWGWVAQVGADRAGFYSYQWLENLVGCDLHNANEIRPEWAHRVGSALKLHPDMPGMPVAAYEPERYFIAAGAPDGSTEGARSSWGFYVEPLDGERTRVISRIRADYPDGLATALQFGPYFTESVGFVMDRRMLLGIKERAERSTRRA